MLEKYAISFLLNARCVVACDLLPHIISWRVANEDYKYGMSLPLRLISQRALKSAYNNNIARSFSTAKLTRAFFNIICKNLIRLSGILLTARLTGLHFVVEIKVQKVFAL